MNISKLATLHYVKSPIIFLADLSLSLIASLSAYLFIQGVSGHALNDGYLTHFAIASIVWTSVLILIFRLNKDIIRYISLMCILKISLLALIKTLGLAAWAYGIEKAPAAYPIYGSFVDFLATTFLLVFVRVGLIGCYRKLINHRRGHENNALFYGTTGLNPSLIQQINSDLNSKNYISGFLSTNPDIIGHYISGCAIHAAQQPQEKLVKLFKKGRVKTVIFASYERFKGERDGLVEFCMQNKINMLVVGKIMKADSVNKGPQIKDIQIEDILNRAEIEVDRQKIEAEVKGETILVTGAAGSIGSELANQLAAMGPKNLILLDAAETPMHNVMMDFQIKHPEVEVHYKIGDIRSKQRVENVLKLHEPSIIFHAAAYKHVPMMESNPCESILTNVWGTYNLASRAKAHGVRKFIMISTDKAVNPTNIMGATKRLAEMYIQSLNEEGKTEFITTRFGNVLGSNGSVIPHFKKQIKRGGPVTVTHPDIIRYFMTIPEACRLVLQAATIGKAEQIMVFDMGEPEKIADLARKMIRLAGLEPDKDIHITYTGLRPGEKLYEELLATKENTLESEHEKIRIAQCIRQDHDTITAGLLELVEKAKTRNTPQVVKHIKQLVPEFKSNNNKEFEQFDKK